MVLRDCTRKLDSDFNVRALNAVRAAALAKKKENEKIVVHVTLLKPFEWNQKREVKIKFKNKISFFFFSVQRPILFAVNNGI